MRSSGNRPASLDHGYFDGEVWHIASRFNRSATTTQRDGICWLIWTWDRNSYKTGHHESLGSHPSPYGQIVLMNPNLLVTTSWSFEKSPWYYAAQVKVHFLGEILTLRKKDTLPERRKTAPPLRSRLLDLVLEGGDNVGTLQSLQSALSRDKNWGKTKERSLSKQSRPQRLQLHL